MKTWGSKCLGSKSENQKKRNWEDPEERYKERKVHSIRDTSESDAQGVRDFARFSPQWNVSIKFLL